MAVCPGVPCVHVLDLCSLASLVTVHVACYIEL